MPGGLTAWMLNATFRANLRIALVGGGRPWTMSAYLEEDPRARDITFLDTYAAERWETVLHYMVASSQQAGISEDASNTLLQVSKVEIHARLQLNQGKSKCRAMGPL